MLYTVRGELGTISQKPVLMKTLGDIGLVIVSLLSAYGISSYLQWEPIPLVRLILFLVIFVASLRLRSKRENELLDISRLEIAIFLCLSTLFSLSLILGFHIVIGDGYSGTNAENYITPYTGLDMIAVFFIDYGVFAIALATYVALKRQATKSQSSIKDGAIDDRLLASDRRSRFGSIGFKWVLSLGLIIFLSWTPYFFIYYPGLIMGDSLASLDQALGLADWNNHHPVAYTFVIFCCIKLASIFGFGVNAGCALYSLLQMLLMSVCFSYLSRWIVVRCKLSSIWMFVFAAYFACTPYIAAYSVAMWKDPLFSAAIVLLTVLLFDFAISKGAIVSQQKSWIVLFITSLVVVSLFRSNGIYVSLLLCLGLTGFLLMHRKHGLNACVLGQKKAFGASIVIVVLVLVLTGPIYKGLGVIQPAEVEKVGLLFNQMARVAANDGVMSEDDERYLGDILPLEQYREKYRPCCVDLLKWDEEFNGSNISAGFVSHWVSLLIKNPGMYLESWELETCGYWAVNQPTVLSNTNNLSGGVPRDLETGAPIQDQLSSESVEDRLLDELFPIDEWNIPLSVINWVIVYISACLVLLRKRSWLLCFIPLYGVILTLLVASPIYYWARYEAAAHFLIPFYVALVYLMIKLPQSFSCRFDR